MTGKSVIVTRGSSRIPRGSPGCLRAVRGLLVGTTGMQCQVRLLEDDPLSTISEWSHSGDVGSWSRSQVRERKPGYWYIRSPEGPVRVIGSTGAWEWGPENIDATRFASREDANEEMQRFLVYRTSRFRRMFRLVRVVVVKPA